MGKLRVDLTGATFDRLSVVEFAGRGRTGIAQWRCRCLCGKEHIVLGCNLKSGSVTSCGCKVYETRNVTHGKSQSPAYCAWKGMIARCTNPKHAAYRHYGGRGIAVCEQWKTFSGFYADMGDPPLGKSIERKDVNGNYEPRNCTWATMLEQGRNRRHHCLLTFAGRTAPLSVWAESAGLPYATVYWRLTRGWPPERLLEPQNC